MGRRMGFDRNGEEGGLEVTSLLENGKAWLEITVRLLEGYGKDTRIRITVTDGNGQQAGIAVLPGGAVRSTRILLLHPHLWQGIEDPHLYQIEAKLLAGECVQDSVERLYALRSLKSLPVKGLFLNGRPFSLQAVDCRAEELQERWEEDLLLLRELGANTVCLEKRAENPLFEKRCLELGILVLFKGDTEEWLPQQLPLLRGQPGEALVSADFGVKRDAFYFYKAKWAREPFVHICGSDEIYRAQGSKEVSGEQCGQERAGGQSGHDIRVYSNQKKAALYVNGVLFEFQEGPPEFVFREVPFEKEITVLTVCAGECYQSAVFHRHPLEA